MALQDLTPQLRTRLNRVEWAVGWFVVLATVLLIFGFGYYLYRTAEDRGWFLRKIHYHTSISSGAGLKLGAEVKLLGFNVGKISKIELNDPSAYYNLTVEFEVNEPYFGYIWNDSAVKVESDVFNNHSLEITKGVRGAPTVLEDTNKNPLAILRGKYTRERMKELTKTVTNEDEAYQLLKAEIAKDRSAFYTNITSKSVYWLQPDESPSLADQAQALVTQIKAELPGIFALTNKINAVLENTASLTSNLNEVASGARATVTNLAMITDNLRNPRGSLGEWVLPTNTHSNLDALLANANVTVTNLDTNLIPVLEGVTRNLVNLAGITSNLNQQVQTNANLLKSISDIIIHTDDLVQGLKRHWLLRSAFRTPATNAPALPDREKAMSPKAKADARQPD